MPSLTTTTTTPVAYYRLASTCPQSPELDVLRLEDARREQARAWAVPHRRDYYQVLWVQGGGGQLLLNFEPVDVTAGRLVLVAPSQVLWVPAATQMRGYLVLFKAAYLHNLTEAVQVLELVNQVGQRKQTSLTVPVEEADFLEQVLGTLHRECAAYEAFGSETILRYALTVFLTKCAQLARQAMQHAPTAPASPLAAAFLTLLDQQFLTRHTVEFYANELGAIPDTLSAACRRAYGQTANQLIAARRLLEAKQRLWHSRASVKEISYALGFADTSHFVKFFRKHVAQTPRQFRG